jgi:hypothetical protein
MSKETFDAKNIFLQSPEGKMSGEVLMERRPAAPASGHLSIHR